MGTTTVTEIFSRARDLVHDSAGSRWVDAELIRWFNDGLKEVVLHKPSANSARTTLTLVAGSIQELPAGAIQLLKITHNSTSKKACRFVDQDRLDAAEPGWRAAPGTVDADHYMYDPETPMEYQVYPPNTGGGQLEATLATEPADVTTVGETIPLNDIYVPCMVDYLIYRAYSKHSKFTGNEQRAKNARERFLTALGVKMQLEQRLDPRQTIRDEQGVE